jgi:hypothetical protein
MEQTQAIAQLLRTLADLVETLDRAELQEVTQLVKTVRRRKSSRPTAASRAKRSSAPKVAGHRVTSSKPASKPAANIVNLVSELSKASSREMGYSLLDSFELNKRAMTEAARFADIHINKNDDVSVVREKLVESIVGRPINSRAVRGYDLK